MTVAYETLAPKLWETAGELLTLFEPVSDTGGEGVPRVGVAATLCV